MESFLGYSKLGPLVKKGLLSLKNDGIWITLWRAFRKLKNKVKKKKDEAFDLSVMQTVSRLEEAYRPDERVYNEPVDLILPVFNGWDIIPPLLESIPRTKVPYRLIIVDDKSSDESILPMLRAYAERHDNTILLENEVNLGYTKSINRALALTKGNVVLLNSDIRLPELWLERLITPIVTREGVASATPFTNSAEICSFPNFCKNNELFLGMSVDEIDAAFSKVVPQYIAMPTGIGFCMALSRKAIDKIGCYDEETFPVGYGEENDWCQRAIKSGFRNVMVENLFVYHQHGATFTPERKKRLIEENLRKLNEKHRNYEGDIVKFIRKDPAKAIRETIKMELLNAVSVSKTILAFDHAWGGGATHYLNRKVEEATKNNGKFIVIRYRESSGDYIAEYYHEAYNAVFSSKTLGSILEKLPENMDEIWINELTSYPDLFATHDTIKAFAQKAGAKLIFRLHDFFCICPGITLLDEKECFCGVKTTEKCNGSPCSKTDMKLWRGQWEKFLLACDEITAFSNDSIHHLLAAYPAVQKKVKLVPHQPKPLEKVHVTPNQHFLTIGLLGGISMEKGLHIVRRMCEQIDRERLPIRIRLIGYAGEPMNRYKCFSQTGEYKTEQLPSLVQENEIDIVLISSICPETFSYTASEAISMGLPVACFDLGAPAERVRGYEKGLIIENVSATETIFQIWEFIKKEGCDI